MQIELGGVVAGVVLAVVTGTLIPFLTSQFSSWAEDRRSRRDGQSKALTDFLAERERREEASRKARERMRRENRVGHIDIDYEGDQVGARAGLLARLGVWDNSLRTVVGYVENWDRPEDVAILGTWANGHHWLARFYARRRVRKEQALRRRLEAEAEEQRLQRLAATETQP